jgi:(p)ppGpp synthase/HD superfamily hydrolase
MIFPAIEFAAKAHAGQLRKGTKIPYIVHPLGVAKILIEHDCSEEVIVAGILHDTVEDTPITIEDIRGKFGAKVASLVQGASEPDKSDTWENRKRHTLENLKTTPLDVLLVSLADKLDNIRAIREDYEKLGDAVWSRFNRSRESQAWYYRSLVSVFSLRISGKPFDSLVQTLKSEVEKVF